MKLDDPTIIKSSNELDKSADLDSRLGTDTIALNLDIHHIHVDSKNRDTNVYPNGNYYVLNFTTPIKEVVKVDLVSAKVPNSMYNLNNGSNVFSTYLTQYQNLVPGHYSSCSLVDEMNKHFDIKGERIYYSQFEGKLYYLTNYDGATFEIYSDELAKMFGLESNVTYTVEPLEFPIYDFYYAVKSQKVVDFSLNEYVFLDVEEFRNPFFNTLSSDSAGNMFAVIPMDVVSGQIKTFKETTDYVMTQNTTHRMTLSKLTIRWYDKNFKLLNFQGFDNNGFVLRVYTQRVVNKPKPLKPRYVREIEKREKEKEPPPPPPKIKFGRWAVFAGIIGILFFWYVTKKFT